MIEIISSWLNYLPQFDKHTKLHFLHHYILWLKAAFVQQMPTLFSLKRLGDTN